MSNSRWVVVLGVLQQHSRAHQREPRRRYEPSIQPRKDPVFSRWLTVLRSINVFLDHYFTLYMLAICVKSQWPSNSLAGTYACQMLSLMRIKTDATYDNKNQEHSPVFYMVMLFDQAFGRACFFDKFHSNFAAEVPTAISHPTASSLHLFHTEILKLSSGCSF